jgi:molybdopterin-synthase adenylyltransferase
MPLIAMNKMRSQPKNPEISLHIPPHMWQEFSTAMCQSRVDNEEVIGFLFCQRYQSSKNKIRYIPQAWVVPTSDCYQSQSISGLVLKQEFHFYLLKNYLQGKKWHVVHIHTHLGKNQPEFSHVDDRYESEYARFLTANFSQKPRLISGVFDELLQQFQLRIWDRKGLSVSPVKLSHSWFELPLIVPDSTPVDLMFARQKVFGETLQKQLGELSVALIGCGGIGSVFAEILGRLGVKNWVLVDPDRLETVNLNRLPASTQNMVEQAWHKVKYVKHLLKKAHPQNACITAIPQSISDSSTQKQIATCDLIVVATDNHRSRQIAQELALRSGRPLIALGTHIEVKPDGTPRMYCRITIPPLGGGWCLMCGNTIDLSKAALESSALEIQNLAASLGYIPEIADPAVFWLNSICASTAVGIIQGMTSNFLKCDRGLDWIYNFPNSNWLQTNVDHIYNRNCYFCTTPDS